MTVPHSVPETTPLASPIKQPPLLQIIGVSKHFRSSRAHCQALRELSFEIREGELLAIVGPSGCGKSTLLSLIAGFEKPSSGEIRVRGQRVEKPGTDRLLLFQEHGLFPWLNVIDNVAYGLRAQRLPHHLRRSRARELLSLVHLDEFENAWIHELSGGMRHRAALARALAPDPALLLIDEPFAALDAATRMRLAQELEQLYSRTHKTMVLVTHDIDEAVCLADRILVFTPRPGSILCEIEVALARPRTPRSPDVESIAQQVRRALQSS